MPCHTPAGRTLLLAAAGVLVALAPAAAQTRRAPVRRDADDRPAPGASAMSVHSDADEPGEMDALTRELWRFARKTPFSAAVRHAERAQERAQRAAGTPTVTLPTGWRIAPAGAQLELGRLPYEAIPFAGRLVVLNDGYYSAGLENPEVSIVDPARPRMVGTLRLASLFPSATTAGGALFVSGGSSDSVFQIDARFQVARAFGVGGYAGPIAALDSTHLAVALLTAPDSLGATGQGSVAVLDVTTGALGPATVAGWFPTAMRVAGGKLYVALVGQHELLVYDVHVGALAPRDRWRRGSTSSSRAPTRWRRSR